MLRQLLNFSAHTRDESADGPGQSDHSPAEKPAQTLEAPAFPGQRPAPQEMGPKPADFDQIYQNAAVKPPNIPYGILKVVEMAASPYLQGMTPDAKRSALLMALEAAGAEIEDLLQDALVRQRALNDYAEKQQEKLSRFEAARAEENRGIQAELDRITAQYMARIQVNVDEVARQQDVLLAWQKRKQEESQRIADTVAFLVPQDNHSYSSGITAVLERGSQPRRLSV